jgi:GTP-binding protein
MGRNSARREWTAERGEDSAATAERARRLPVVAIVGRPNVGKSTLFNRLVRAPRAIVDAQPGVTRDRNVAPASWGGRRFLLVDTGGFEDAEASTLAASVRLQSALAAEEADAVVAMFDGRCGLSPVDRDFMERLRALHKPVLFAVNKLDTGMREDDAAEFFALGVSEVFPLSAAHGRGVGELMERLLAQLPDEKVTLRVPAGAATLAIVGRPNVGKSSLLNRLVGFERAIVDATPGTTRDALDTPLRHGGHDYVLVDTAGIRRRPRVHEHLEKASVVRALRALERAEVAVLVIEATQGMTDQDARVAGYAWERRRALLLAVNKWDAVPDEERDRKRFLDHLQHRYPTLAEVPTVFLSARTGKGVGDLFPALETLIAAHRRELRTVHLNKVLEGATRALAPPSVRGKRPHFRYATQTGTAPPTITIFTSAPQLVQTAYERYLASAVRRAFDLRGVPLQLRFRQSPGRGATSQPRTRSRHTPRSAGSNRQRAKRS